jgi:diguanylate cyclase (GGDEF)-like protein
MGVPMKSENVDGIISIGSYKPNAFDRADLELLSNLAQHAAQALNNTYQHEEVERKSRLDSLTGVYNHGNFLKLLKEQTDQAALERQPLGLIMLDVDFFKQYNDTYGHLVGDEVLTTLCATIKLHIKTQDAVGRWGGEEFVISLPNADAEQAKQIALRIRETLSTLKIKNKEGDPISVPTVSQGIAIFPKETNDIIELIDLADKRLYIAKDRGRDQIESDSFKLEKAPLDQER